MTALAAENPDSATSKDLKANMLKSSTTGKERFLNLLRWSTINIDASRHRGEIQLRRPAVSNAAGCWHRITHNLMILMNMCGAAVGFIPKYWSRLSVGHFKGAFFCKSPQKNYRSLKDLVNFGKGEAKVHMGGICIWTILHTHVHTYIDSSC